MGLIEEAIGRVDLSRSMSIPIHLTRSHDAIRVVLIDRSVKEHGLFLEACQKKGVETILYDGLSTRTDILSKILEKGVPISSIGLVFHGTGSSGGVFLDGESFFSEKNTQWLADLCNGQHLERLDFISCETAKHASWNEFYAILEEKSGDLGTAIGRSDKLVGNEAFGGSWTMQYVKASAILETKYRKEISTDYFDQDAIIQYHGKLMATNLTATILDTSSISLSYTVSGSPATYLYRINNPSTYGFTAPAKLPSGAISIRASITTNGTVVDNKTPLLSPNNQYIYAFYNGGDTGVSTIDNSGIQILLKTYGDVIALTEPNAGTSTTNVTLNFTLQNTLSIPNTAYLYRFSQPAGTHGTAFSVPITSLNGSYSQTLVTSFTTAAGAVGSATTNATTSYNDTTVSENVFYYYAFFDGSANGSTIMTDLSGSNKYVTTTTFATVTSISNSIVANKTATISYNVTNGTSSSTSFQLYGFPGNAPISNPTGQTNVGPFDPQTLGAGSSNTYSSDISGLSLNTPYQFALYDSTTGTIMCDVNGSKQVTSLTTSGVLNTALTSTYITPTQTTINYTLSNPSSQNDTVYLYHYDGSGTAPTTLDSSGFLVTSYLLSANYPSTDGSGTWPGLTNDHYYTYGFYDGNIVGVSALLTSDLSGQNYKRLVVYSGVDTVAFNGTNTVTDTSATIQFTLSKGVDYPSNSCYLFRFTTDPVLATAGYTGNPINLLLSNPAFGAHTQVGSASVTSTLASITDIGLTNATQYYYAFFNGNVSTSQIITDVNGVPQSTRIVTSNLYNSKLVLSVTTSTPVLNTSIALDYTLTNLHSNTVTVPVANAYLYRFSNASSSPSAPTSNPTSGVNATLVPNGTNTLTPSTSTETVTTTIMDASLSPHTYYTYAFYDGTGPGAGILLGSYGGSAVSLSTQTTNIDVLQLSGSYVTETLIDLSYQISNLDTSRNTFVYLYRYNDTTSGNSIVLNKPATTLPPNPNNNPPFQPTLISTITVNGGVVDISGTIPDNPLTDVYTYYYAFYDGTIKGQSSILSIASAPLSTSYITVQNYAYVNSLTSTNVTFTSADVTYNLYNSTIDTSVNYYLYRFVNTPTSSPNNNLPPGNPTSSNATYLPGGSGTLSARTGPSPGITATYSDPSLNQNKSYTYAFFDGQTSSSRPLEYSDGTPMFTCVFTTEYIYSFSSSNIDSSSAVINYTMYNPLLPPYDISTCLYRFTNAPAPTVDPSGGGGLLMKTVFIPALTNTPSSVTGTLPDTGLNRNTAYTYAFYSFHSGDPSGTILVNGNSPPPLDNVSNNGIVDTIQGNAKQSITIFTDMYVLSPVYFKEVTNNYIVLQYYLSYNNAYLTNAYLYRFDASTAPTVDPIGNNGTYITTDYNRSGTLREYTDSSGIVRNQNYTYAFYDTMDSLGKILPLSTTSQNIYQNNLYRTGTQIGTGTSGGYNVLVPVTTATDASATIYSSGQVVNYLNAVYSTNNNIDISYSVTNLDATLASNIYLYRLLVLPDVSLNSSQNGVLLSYNTSLNIQPNFPYSIPSAIGAGATISGEILDLYTSYSNSNPSNPTLTPSTTYYYAFYNGTTPNTSNLLTYTDLTTPAYLSYNTLGITNTSLESLNVTETSADISFVIVNDPSSEPTTVYLYRFSGSSPVDASINLTANGIIDGSFNLAVGNTVSNAGYHVTGLTPNIFYTYAFYSGNVPGKSTILTTDIFGLIPISTNFKTGMSDASFTVVNTDILNTSVNLGYFLGNGTSITLSGYLMRFPGLIAPPTIYNPSGQFVTAISEVSVPVGTLVSGYYLDTSGLIVNHSYTYAFYNGNIAGVSTILTTTVGTNQAAPSLQLTTSDLYNPSLQHTTLTYNSVNISYSLSNTMTSNQINSNAYLYQFQDVSSVPNTILNRGSSTNGTLVSGSPVSVGGSTVNRSTGLISLSQGHYYTYAFYNGNMDGSSTILYPNGTMLTPEYLTIYTNDTTIADLSYSNLDICGAYINYTLTNYLPTQQSCTLYRFDGSSATVPHSNPGSDPSGTRLSLTVDLSGMVADSSAMSVSGTYTMDASSLTPNHQYSYAFYNASGIILDNSQNSPASITIYPTDQPIINTMAALNTTNTSTLITFNSTNNQASAKSFYLFRFTYPTYPPSMLGSSGVQIGTIYDISANTTRTYTSVQDPSLNANVEYFYALYSGNSPSSIILTTYDGTSKILYFYTPAVYDTVLTATQVLPTSVTINYNLDNSVGQDAGITVYLYRYKSSSAPVTLDSSGVSLIPSTGVPLTAGQVTGVQAFTDNAASATTNGYTPLLANNTYTYAFYDGNVNGQNKMLLSASGGIDVSYTVQTFYDVVVGLSSFNTTNTTTDISYTLRSTLTSPSTAYLYRFNGSITPPSTLNNAGTLVINNTNGITVPANGTVSSFIYDPSLNANSLYTYAFYSGNTVNSSYILTDISMVSVSTIVQTGSIYNIDLSVNTLLTNSVTINYTIDNSGQSQTVYLYRFTGYSVPSPLNTTVYDASNIFLDPSYQVYALDCSGGQITTGTVIDNSIVANTTYTYAFYIGNRSSSTVADPSPIMQNLQGTPKTLSINAFYDLVVSLSATDISINSIKLSADIINTLSTDTTAYLVRFDSSKNITSATTLDNSGTPIQSFDVPANSEQKSLQTTDISCNGQTYYTYTLFNGSSPGASVLLNASGDPVVVYVQTKNWLNPISKDINTFSYNSVSKNLYLPVDIDPNYNNGVDVATNWNPSNAIWNFTYPTSASPNPPGTVYVNGQKVNTSLQVTGPLSSIAYTAPAGFVGQDTIYFTLSHTYNSNNYPTGIDSSFVTYTMDPSINITVIPPPPPCFKEGSKILCLNDKMEEEYRAIETIRAGTLVKTYKHGYVPVKYIGTSKLYNSGTDVRKIDKLYRCSKAEYPEMEEEMDDLMLTGCHCILVDELSEEQERASMSLYDTLLITDDKYRLSACFDRRALPYEDKGIFNIWHLALDHEDYYMNYGIYAHGLLVETCSQRSILEMSNMTLA